MYWKWATRCLGLLVGVTMIAVLVRFWAEWRSSSLTPAANGASLPTGIDVIAIQLDILSLVVAVVGVGLGVAGFVGYQAIKSGAEAAAIKAATEKADAVATKAIALHMQNIPGTDEGTQEPVKPGDLTELNDEEEGG